MNISGNVIENSYETTENRQLILIITFVIYAAEGILLIISNGLVELVLVKHRYLRRQYVILFSQVIN